MDEAREYILCDACDLGQPELMEELCPNCPYRHMLTPNQGEITYVPEAQEGQTPSKDKLWTLLPNQGE